MRQHAEPDLPLWIAPKVERKGRRVRVIKVKRKLLDAADRNWKRVLEYVGRELGDRTRAAEILEGVLHSVGTGRKIGKTIRDLDGYIFWAVTRSVKKLLTRERKIEYVPFAQDLEVLEGAQDTEWVSRFENELEMEELLNYIEDQTARYMLHKRMSDYSWRHIGRKLGISPDNARMRLRNALEKARRRILEEKEPKSRPSPAQRI